MPDYSPRLLWPLPNPDEDPWFDSFESLIAAIDASVYGPSREDRNMLLVSTATVGFTAGSGVLTWSAAVAFLCSPLGFFWNLPAGSATLADGQILYAQVPRAPTSNVNLTPQVASNPSPQQDAADTLVLAVRRGNTVFWRNGKTISTGESAAIFSTTGGGGGGVGLSDNPAADLGTAGPGTGPKASRDDHVHTDPTRFINDKGSVYAAERFSNVSPSGSQTVGGVVPPNGSRVLLVAQTSSAERTIWLTNDSGAWTFPPDANAAGMIRAGSRVYVQNGIGAGLTWQQTATGTITPGASPQTWEQFPAVFPEFIPVEVPLPVIVPTIATVDGDVDQAVYNFNTFRLEIPEAIGVGALFLATGMVSNPGLIAEVELVYYPSLTVIATLTFTSNGVYEEQYTNALPTNGRIMVRTRLTNGAGPGDLFLFRGASLHVVNVMHY